MTSTVSTSLALQQLLEAPPEKTLATAGKSHASHG